jgi:serine/threonine protein kinase
VEGRELVKQLEVPKSLITETVYLGDFGTAFKAGTKIKYMVLSPISCRAPELFHKVDPSFASDMWSYMCIFARLYLGHTLWCGFMLSMMLNSMVRTLGPLPWKDHYIGRYYDPSWYDQTRTPDPRSTLERLIKEAQPEASQTERNYVLSIMSKGLCYLPEDRPTATQLLQDASFKALMEIYCP